MSRKRSAANHEVMHEINRATVLSGLRGSPAHTRTNIPKRVGLRRSAITFITDELIQDERIRKAGFETSTGAGRGLGIRISTHMPGAALLGAVARIFADAWREPALTVSH